MNLEDRDKLLECEFFAALLHPDREAVLRNMNYHLQNYAKGTIIHFQGDVYRSLLIIVEGLVSAEIHDPQGKKIKLETFSPVSPIAPGILFATDNTLPVTITAETDAKLLSVSKREILSLLQKNTACLEGYLSLTGDKIVLLAEKIRLFQFNSIQQKIAGYLLNLAKKKGTDTIHLPYTREFMADLFGLARPSLSREFSRLSDAGILEIEKKKVRILKKRALHYILEGKYGTLLDDS